MEGFTVSWVQISHWSHFPWDCMFEFVQRHASGPTVGFLDPMFLLSGTLGLITSADQTIGQDPQSAGRASQRRMLDWTSGKCRLYVASPLSPISYSRIPSRLYGGETLVNFQIGETRTDPDPATARVTNLVTQAMATSRIRAHTYDY